MIADGRRRAAFSLLEVVVAVALLGVVLVVVLGGFGSVARSTGAVLDDEALVRLAGGIRQELERLQAVVGFEGLAAAVPEAGSSSPLLLVGTHDGRRVLCDDGVEPAADRPLNDPALPGIARRDRYFAIEATRQIDLPYGSGAGYLAIAVTVRWPYLVPAGPSTPGATRPAADPAREVPAADRQWIVFQFALRP